MISPVGWKWIGILATVGLLMCRFSGLDHKPYWYDEVGSTYRIVGTTYKEVRNDVESHVDQISDFSFFRHLIDVRADKGFADTVRSLQLEDPQHCPLFFLLGHGWTQVFGSTPSSLRVFSVLLSLTEVPALAWLCFELFGADVVLIGLLLFALSPFHLIYSQQVREYSLWCALTLASTAALLRAQRTGHNRDWFIYGTAMALSFYTFLFSIFTFFAHAVYFAHDSRRNKSLFKLLLAGTFSLGVFGPWLYQIVESHSKVMSNNKIFSNSISPIHYLNQEVLNISRLYLDIYPDNGAWTWIPMIAVFAALGYVIVSFYRLANKKQFYLVSYLFWHMPIALLMTDLILGGRRGVIMRYLTPSWIALGVMTSVSIANGLKSPGRSRILSLSALAVFIASGLVSLSIYLPARDWWTIRPQELDPAAQIIRRAQAPVVVPIPVDPINLISLSFLVPQNSAVIALTSDQIIRWETWPKSVFAFQPPQWLMIKLAADLSLTPTAAGRWLWQGSKSDNP